MRVSSASNLHDKGGASFQLLESV